MLLSTACPPWSPLVHNMGPAAKDMTSSFDLFALRGTPCYLVGRECVRQLLKSEHRDQVFLGRNACRRSSPFWGRPLLGQAGGSVESQTPRLKCPAMTGSWASTSEVWADLGSVAARHRAWAGAAAAVGGRNLECAADLARRGLPGAAPLRIPASGMLPLSSAVSIFEGALRDVALHHSRLKPYIF